jgi:hypothetical protein
LVDEFLAGKEQFASDAVWVLTAFFTHSLEFRFAFGNVFIDLSFVVKVLVDGRVYLVM